MIGITRQWLRHLNEFVNIRDLIKHPAFLPMAAFLGKDLVPMNRICERAEMSEVGIFALFKYFRLPFNPDETTLS